MHLEFVILVLHLRCFRFLISLSGLKGNRVRIPDSPAAVFSTTVIQSYGHCFRQAEMGRPDKPGVSQKTCLCVTIHSFRGLKLEWHWCTTGPFLYFFTICLLWDKQTSQQNEKNKSIFNG